VHTYEPLWTEGMSYAPFIDAPPMRGLDDVARLAPYDPVFGLLTYPTTIHLDGAGRFRCASHLSSFDGLRWWDERREGLEADWERGVGRRCGANWLIIEPRPRSQYRDGWVTEDDARIYLKLKDVMAEVGMNILDVIVTNDEHRWWSMHELTTGTTEWTFVPRLIRKRRTTHG
jgi:hypothetical protein